MGLCQLFINNSEKNEDENENKFLNNTVERSQESSEHKFYLSDFMEKYSDFSIYNIVENESVTIIEHAP